MSPRWSACSAPQRASNRSSRARRDRPFWLRRSSAHASTSRVRSSGYRVGRSDGFHGSRPCAPQTAPTSSTSHRCEARARCHGAQSRCHVRGVAGCRVETPRTFSSATDLARHEATRSTEPTAQRFDDGVATPDDLLTTLTAPVRLRADDVRGTHCTHRADDIHQTHRTHRTHWPCAPPVRRERDRIAGRITMHVRVHVARARARTRSEQHAAPSSLASSPVASALGYLVPTASTIAPAYG